LPEPAPFDREACLARAARLRKYEGDETIRQLEVPLSMTPPEARFWFEVLTRIDGQNPPRAIAEKLATQRLEGSLGRGEIEKKLKRWKGYTGNIPPLLRCLATLLPVEEVLEVFLGFLSAGYWSSGTPSFYAD
jgi:hypothetical protein